MALATLTARVDESDKSAFDSFCSSVGLTTSAAIIMYVKAVLRERRIPFDIKQDDPFYSLVLAVRQVPTPERKEGKLLTFLIHIVAVRILWKIEVISIVSDTDYSFARYLDWSSNGISKRSIACFAVYFNFFMIFLILSILF